MKEFDIKMSMNGYKNELDDNKFNDNSYDQIVNRKNSKNYNHSSFVGEPIDEKKTSWTDTLTNLTNQFKEVTNYRTNEEIKEEKDKELKEKGSKYKILGMNPFVAISFSFLIIIGGSYAITKIKAG